MQINSNKCLRSHVVNGKKYPRAELRLAWSIWMPCVTVTVLQPTVRGRFWKLKELWRGLWNRARGLERPSNQTFDSKGPFSGLD